MNLCKVRNRTMLSGFPAGRDRAGGLPPQRVSCHDGNAAPPRMLAQLVGSRCHAMPSRVTAKSISRDFRNSANIKICRASFMPRYLFRWQFSAASADQHQNCTALTGALDPFSCYAMERLACSVRSFAPNMKQIAPQGILLLFFLSCRLPAYSSLLQPPGMRFCRTECLTCEAANSSQQSIRRMSTYLQG